MVEMSNSLIQIPYSHRSHTFLDTSEEWVELLCKQISKNNERINILDLQAKFKDTMKAFDDFKNKHQKYMK